MMRTMKVGVVAAVLLVITTSFVFIPSMQALVSGNPTTLPIESGDRIYLGYFPHSSQLSMSVNLTSPSMLEGSWTSTAGAGFVVFAGVEAGPILHFFTNGTVSEYLNAGQLYYLVFYAETQAVITITSTFHLVPVG